MIELFESKLDIKLRERDIDVAHRLGKFIKKEQKSRAIIVKFMRRDDRMKVIKNCRKLKGSSIVVIDDICRHLQLLYNRVSSDPNVKKAWTWHSHVYVMDQDDNVRQMSYGQTLDNVLSFKK